MLQIGRGLDLGQESLRANDRGQLRAQHLERHLAVVLEVLRQVDGGHATGAHLVLDGVAVGQSCGQAIEIGHGAPCSVRMELGNLGW